MVIGIQYKHRRKKRPIGVDVIDTISRALPYSDLHQAVILTSTLFTQHAKNRVRDFGTSIALWTFDDIRSRLGQDSQDDGDVKSSIIALIDNFGHRLAQAVAEDPTALEYLEWRDLERMLAKVFEGLNFKTTLTPPAKDGGKDIIIEFVENGVSYCYIVEIKHWRCGQRVVGAPVRSFVEVVVNEKRDGGIFLSSSGFTDNTFEMLLEIDTSKIWLGENNKIVSLCKSYVRAMSGCWLPYCQPTKLLTEETLQP